MNIPSNKQINEFLAAITAQAITGSTEHQELFGKIIFYRLQPGFNLFLHSLVNCWLEKGFDFEALHAIDPKPVLSKQTVDDLIKQGYLPKAKIWESKEARKPASVRVLYENKTRMLSFSDGKNYAALFKDPQTTTLH